MKVSDKLAYFKDVVGAEAEEQGRKLTAMTEEKFLRAAEAAGKDAERRAGRRVQAETYRIEIEKNKLVVNAAIAAKKSAVELRSHLINEIFGGVAAKAEDFVKTDGYADYLRRNIAESVKPYPGARVIVMERDKNAVSALTGAHAFDYTGDDFIGGFKIFLPERNAVLDCTLKNRIAGEKKSFNRLRGSFETGDGV